MKPDAMMHSGLLLTYFDRVRWLTPSVVRARAAPESRAEREPRRRLCGRTMANHVRAPRSNNSLTSVPSPSSASVSATPQMWRGDPDSTTLPAPMPSVLAAPRPLHPTPMVTPVATPLATPRPAAWAAPPLPHATLPSLTAIGGPLVPGTMPPPVNLTLTLTPTLTLTLTLTLALSLALTLPPSLSLSLTLTR